MGNKQVKYTSNLCISFFIFFCLTTVIFFLLMSKVKMNGTKYKDIEMDSEETKSVVKTNKTFQIKLKPGLFKLINPTTPKYALTVNASYHLENRYLCLSKKDITIFVMILSAPNNFQKRNIIRKTWGNSSFYSSFGTVKIMFLLGRTVRANDQNKINEEFTRNRDILQGNFIDSYHNLSHKTVMCYKWLTERCRNAKYVMKADDDIVVNMFYVFQNCIANMSVNQYHVHCFLKKHSLVFRGKGSKWYVEPHQFIGAKYYMPYCLGQYVMILNDIVPYLYQAASVSPFFWIDDVYSYGIVMGNIKPLKYKKMMADDFVSYSKLTTLNCWKQTVPYCRHVFIDTEGVSQIREVWLNIILQYYTNV